MFRFGKQVESALLALKALGESLDSGFSIAEICSKHGLSRNTLSKVMQNLQSAQILESSQGLKGGYRLKRPLKAISFFEVLEALGEIKKLNCSENKSCHLVENCSISSPLQKWEKNFEEQLKTTTLEQLLVESEESRQKNTAHENTKKMETTCL